MSSLSTSTTDVNVAKGSGEEIQFQEQVTNVFFSEEREVSSSKVYASEPTFSSVYSDSIMMPEKKWLLSEILSRPIQLPTIEWSTSDAFRAEVASLDIPRSLYSLSVVPITTILSMMSFMRSDWTIRLQLNSPKFSQGRLLAYFDPMYSRPIGSGELSQDKLSIYNAMVLPHAWLDPSESRVVELVLPFRHILDYFNLISSSGFSRSGKVNSLGALRFVVFNPLQVSTGTSSSVYLTPSFYAQEPNVHVPTFFHALDPPTISVAECGLTDALGVVSDVVEAGAAIATGSPGMVTSTLKAVSSVSKVLQNLDRPLAYGEIMLPCNKMIAPLAHGSGVDSCVRLSLIENSQTQASSSNMGDAHKEMDLSSIIKIPTIIARLSWSVSNSPDTVLSFWPATPFFIAERTFDGPTTCLSYNNLGAWAARFRFWRGGLRFRFSFVCTQFHAGRLRVSYFPSYWDGTTPPDSTRGTSVPSMIMDLQTKKEFEFVVPYYASTPYLYMPYPYEMFGTNFHFNTQNLIDMIGGQIVVYVLNPLIVNSNAPSDININVFVSAADDFEFSGLTPMQPELVNPVAVTECGKVEAPGDIEEGETLIVKPTANVLSHGSGIVNTPYLFQAGESYMNIKNLIRRYGFLTSYTVPATAPVFPNSFVIKVPLSPNDYFSLFSATDNRCQNIFCYVSSMFLTWKGSIRYKVLSTVSKNAQLLGFAFHDLLDHTATSNATVVPFKYNAFSFASDAMNFSFSPSFEVEVPYLSHLSSKIVRNSRTDTNFDNFYSITSNLKFMFIQTADTVFPVVAGAQFMLFSAAGDDFVLSFYLGPLIICLPYGDVPV
jgi:hypothetical protein